MIHCYRFKDLNILLDVNSGAVHVVSDAAADILAFFEPDHLDWQNRKSVVIDKLSGMGDEGVSAKYDRAELLEAAAEIEELISEGMLFTEEDAAARIVPESRSPVIKAMCLHAAHDCNMRCAYCFGSEGSFSGERSLLSLEIGEKAIDFLLTHSGNRRNLEIDFFGGEPLMNFEVVKDLVHYGRVREQEYGKNIRFTITTNALFLDEAKEAFINENMDNVILSIDGRPEVNDRMRKTVSGSGTYDHIIGNLTRFRDNRKGLYYVRGTYTAYNKDFSEDVKHLVDLGFRNVSVEPVVTDRSNEYALTEGDVPILMAEYDKLADLYLDYENSGRKFSFFHFNIDLSQGPCVYKRIAGCGAGTEYVAVAPNGDIYPCHQFVGNEEFKIGNVENEVFENRLYDMFNSAHIYEKETCMSCWARFYCSGGCHANAWHEHNNILEPYELGCILEKKRLECAIGILAKNDPIVSR